MKIATIQVRSEHRYKRPCSRETASREMKIVVSGKARKGERTYVAESGKKI
jgi:hypothetical protein